MAEVEKVSHEVICDKLLIALQDSTKVAIVLTEDDVNMLINVLSLAQVSTHCMSFLMDLKQLRKEAYGY